jgi:hypothetical protein
MADKSIIGTELGETTFPVERGKVREFAQAVLDDNPAYLEDERPPAPPTFTMTTALWPRKSDAPSPDLKLNYARILHGEQHFEYLGPVHAGDTLTGRTRVADVYEKEGKRGGTMTFVVLETTFSNQEGEDVVISKNVLIETAKPATEGEK